MIRYGIKKYGEMNNPNTCTTSNTMTLGKVIILDADKKLAVHPANKKGILTTDADGKISFFPVPDGEAGYNKLLVTDGVNLKWVDREV